MHPKFTSHRSTLADVARLAGVSSMTVSRVIRGVRVVKESTIKRVKLAIARADYHPDPTMSALAAYRTNRTRQSIADAIAFLDCDQNSYSAAVLSGVQSEAANLGYRIQTFLLPRDRGELKRLGRILFHRGIRGILVGPSQVECRFGGWNWDQFAAVSIGALNHEPPMHSVSMDYWQGAIDGAQTLYNGGCRHIALSIDDSLEQRTGYRWKSGYAIWCHQAGVHPVYLNPHQSPTSLTKQFHRYSTDGILTIHQNVWKVADPHSIKLCFLNGWECPRGETCLALDAGKIGAESVRLLHPLLLRREFGLPESPKAMQLRGMISRIVAKED